ncbi:MAG: hypothetical protein ACRC0G_03965 [Fusobacteriaceae bacterium]
MEKGLFSKEILEVIFKNIKVFFVVAFLFFGGVLLKIMKFPEQYKAISYFRYMGIEPGEITVKKDNNGTVTLTKYKLGEGNLDIQTLFKSKEFIQIKGDNRATLTFDSGNGNHILEVIGVERESILNISEIYLEKILKSNRDFIERKISIENDKEKKDKYVFELENIDRSFPLIVKAEKTEKVDSKKGIFIFFALIIAMCLGIIASFIAQALKEIGEVK